MRDARFASVLVFVAIVGLGVPSPAFGPTWAEILAWFGLGGGSAAEEAAEAPAFAPKARCQIIIAGVTQEFECD